MHHINTFFLILIVITLYKVQECRKEKTLDQLGTRVSGFETSSEVSNLVSREFGTNVRNQTAENQFGIFSSILKLVGLEGNKIGAIAVNSLVVVSQMIADNFNLPPDITKKADNENKNIIASIIQGILSRQTENVELFNEASKEDLLNLLTEEGKVNSKTTTCTKLLLCKIQPFVKEMQNNMINMIRQEKQLIMDETSFPNFPSIDTLLEEFANCDAKYDQCIYK